MGTKFAQSGMVPSGESESVVAAIDRPYRTF